MNERLWWMMTMYSFLCFVIITVFVEKQQVQLFDHTLINYIQHVETSWLTYSFTFMTHIGSFFGTIVILCVTLYICYKKQLYEEALILSFITLITPIVNLFMKVMIQRPRPNLNRLLDISGFSYPSGHMMYATALYGTMLILFWAIVGTTWQRTILLFGVLTMISTIGISRIYLGVHYPSDIIAGFLCSLFIISVTKYLFALYQK